jgi:alkanesulfonate monooxygenase SsuD/methylene tetrahydromethanopterin reductase-like flavin-dependent oxidoreductase (luciferase family)
VQFDIFFSICQTPVRGYTPSEYQMFRNFSEQLILADALGFGCAWIAETHLSCQVQKRNPGAVIPHFQGEIGLNTDVLQVANRFAGKTEKIHFGSAIRNILCNGGPIAHAEAVKMFLSLHGLDLEETRLLELGFASGRFPFSNRPYGIAPRSEVERVAWPALRGMVFLQATEIFLRVLNGEILSSRDLAPLVLTRSRFRSESDWQSVQRAAEMSGLSPVDAGSGHQKESGYQLKPFWDFDPVGVIPYEPRRDLLRLTIGAHDAESHALANRYAPVGVFNLSITPAAQIEETHRRMQGVYHKDGGPWSRRLMPRTALVFLDSNTKRAREMAEEAVANYWTAMEGTLDPQKVAQAVDNALVGDAVQIAEQVKSKYHPEDRLMLWFDFNNHDSADVMRAMRSFVEDVIPRIR